MSYVARNKQIMKGIKYIEIMFNKQLTFLKKTLMCIYQK